MLASDTREIEVILDPARLTAAGLTVVDVSDALNAQNQLLPVGRFQESGLQHLALASGLWKNLDDIANAPVLVKSGATVRVRDIGTVAPGAPDRTLLVTGNGRDAVSVSIAQQIGANILDLKAGVDATLASIAEDAARPASRSTACTTSPSSSRNRSPACATPSSSAASSPIIVLLVFLRDWRLTTIAAVTLPMAVGPDVRLHVALRRHDQPDVDGRPRGRHRPRHRRRRRRRGEHPPSRRRRGRAASSTRCSS